MENLQKFSFRLPFIKVLTPEFSVASQLSLDQVNAVKTAGYKSIVINRPDFEDDLDQQPTSSSIIFASNAIGLSVRYFPIGRNFTKSDLIEFADILNILPTPVLAYCHTGFRSAKLFFSL